MVITKYKQIQEENKYIEVKNVNYSAKEGKIRKRVFDIIFSLLILPIIFPFMILIAIAIKLKSPKSSIFFTQKRLGLNGKLFTVYKFSTMIPNSEEILEEWLEKDKKVREEYLTYRKLQNDPRIIKGIGTFLRKSSLDELPQFFNVLLGDMSVVGPRPYIKNEFNKNNQYLIKTICSVKPGVTGLWQVTERNGTDFNSRLKKDIEYISNQSFLGDIKIIFLTFKVMIFREGV